MSSRSTSRRPSRRSRRSSDPSEGRAFVEVVAVAPGTDAITFRVGDEVATKAVATGDIEPPKLLQPERVRGLSLFLWPGEHTLEGSFERIVIPHPERPVAGFGWSPVPLEGVMGITLVFLVFSIVIGGAALKPLGVQI